MYAVQITFPDTGNTYYIGRGYALVELEDALNYDSVEHVEGAMKVMAAHTFSRVVNGRRIACTNPKLTLAMV